MKGLWIEGGEVLYRTDLPACDSGAHPGECRVRVATVGICATDLALREGYMGFKGVPGHEFVGVALDGPLCGQRVVGEINAGCGVCEDCQRGDPRHCKQRTVLGILGRSGAFAEELSLPAQNLHRVPEGVDSDSAVFSEPLAAAFELTEQLDLSSVDRALVLGDGRLGLLCAQVLGRYLPRVDVMGRHPERESLTESHVSWVEEPVPDGWPLVVEATGDPDMLEQALAWVEPRGQVALKTTSSRPASLDLAPLVVKEVQLLGSRCGRFGPALRALQQGWIDPRPMIRGRFPLEQGPEAFELAACKGALKVLVDIGK